MVPLQLTTECHIATLGIAGTLAGLEIHRPGQALFILPEVQVIHIHNGAGQSRLQ